MTVGFASGGRALPRFHAPDGLAAIVPSSHETGTVAGVWTIPSPRMRVVGSLLFVAFAVVLSWGSSSGTRAFFETFAAVASIAMLIYGETRWLCTPARSMRLSSPARDTHRPC